MTTAHDYADKRWLRHRAKTPLSWAAKVAVLAIFAVACIAFA